MPTTLPGAGRDPYVPAVIAKESLINGNAAFFNKSDVPTYLVGTQSGVEKLLEIVPTPSERYSRTSDGCMTPRKSMRR